MDPTIASYFRAILFRDAKSPEPIPASLVELYRWIQKSHAAMNLGTAITKPVAISIVLTWLPTAEGRQWLFQQQEPISHLFPVDSKPEAKTESKQTKPKHD
jgi:hypothetical protein